MLDVKELEWKEHAEVINLSTVKLERKQRVLVLSSIPPRKPTDKPGESWMDLYEVIGQTHQKYCARHGYSYKLDVSDIWDRERDSKLNTPQGQYKPIKYFIKFRLFEHFLNPESCLQEWDWIVWLDSDLVLSNYDIPLEKFFNQARGDEPQAADIQLTWDVNGLHATVIMMRRNPITLGFAWACGNAGQTYFQTDGWGDQLALRRFLETPPYNRLVHYHSIKELCAMPPKEYFDYPIPAIAKKPYEWEPGDFGMHLSALSIPKRIEIAKRVITEQGL